MDMAAVFAEMERDAVGPAEFRERGRPDGVGLVGAASLPDGGDVVDVDAKKSHESNDTRGAGGGKWAVLVAVRWTLGLVEMLATSDD